MTKSNDITTHAKNAAQLMKALSNEARLLILCHLTEKEMSVGELLALSKLKQSAFSQHLAKLREEGLVSTRKEAQTVYYSISNNSVGKVLKTLQQIYCP